GRREQEGSAGVFYHEVVKDSPLAEHVKPPLGSAGGNWCIAATSRRILATGFQRNPSGIEFATDKWGSWCRATMGCWGAACHVGENRAGASYVRYSIS